MKNILYLQKQKGETPLACIERFRAGNPEYADIPMTYAGRLDPIATGRLLVLAGEECKKKDKYLSFDKEYEARVILGVQTDSYDILGIPETFFLERGSCADEILAIGDKILDTCLRRGDGILTDLQKMVGKFTQTYPPYSSKTVNGKQLHQYAREGRIGEIDMPTKDVEIYGIGTIRIEKISGVNLKKEILETIDLVKGDFRQELIKERWKDVIEGGREYQILSFTIHVSSGTYIRSIAHNLGGTLLSLNRTKIL